MSFRPFRSLASLALSLIVLGPGAAAAQFTTFTAHPPRVDSARTPAVALTDSAKRARADSTSQVAIANMKTWVDSAAVAAGTQVPAPVESTTVITTGSATTVADAGMRAPNTASPLPTLLAGGAALLLAGLALRRRRA